MNRRIVISIVLIVIGCTMGAAPRAHAGIAAARTAGSVQCPAALPPGSNAASGVLAAVLHEIPNRYPGRIHRGYRIDLLISLAGKNYLLLNKETRVLWQIAVSQCGKTVANRSWLVLLTFPRAFPSESMGSGQLYVARTASGWHVWFQFH